MKRALVAWKYVSGLGKYSWIMLVLTAALTGGLQAQITGPVYPPQGGVTFSASGASGQVAGEASGRTFFYTNFTETQLAALFWTFSAVENPRLQSQSSTGQMSFSSFNASTGIATWNSTANLTWNSATSGTISTATRLLVQFQPYTGTATGQLGSGWLVPTTASTAGISSLPAAQSVLNVLALPGTDNYQVWIRYQTAAGNPLLDYYDSTNSTSGSTALGSTGGFYQTVIPEPSTVGLTILASTAFGLVRRRRSGYGI